MTTQRSTSYHRKVATRNVEAILDAAEELLRQEGHATISAVAAQAGVSRVTVYAHFPTWEALLEAAVERAVLRTVAALEAASPAEGLAAEALERVLAAGWIDPDDALRILTTSVRDLFTGTSPADRKRSGSRQPG